MTLAYRTALVDGRMVSIAKPARTRSRVMDLKSRAIIRHFLGRESEAKSAQDRYARSDGRRRKGWPS